MIEREEGDRRTIRRPPTQRRGDGGRRERRERTVRDAVDEGGRRTTARGRSDEDPGAIRGPGERKPALHRHPWLALMLVDLEPGGECQRLLDRTTTVGVGEIEAPRTREPSFGDEREPVASRGPGRKHLVHVSGADPGCGPGRQIHDDGSRKTVRKHIRDDPATIARPLDRTVRFECHRPSRLPGRRQVAAAWIKHA